MTELAPEPENVDPALESENFGPIQNDPVVTEEERNKFFVSILEDKPYSEWVDIFDGKVQILFRDRYAPEMNALAELMVEKQPKMAMDMDRLYMRWNLAAALSAVKVGEKEISYELPPEVTHNLGAKVVLEKRAELLDSFPRSKFLALINKLQSFDRKLGFLTEECAKPDFFSKAPGDTSEL